MSLASSCDQTDENTDRESDPDELVGLFMDPFVGRAGAGDGAFFEALASYLGRIERARELIAGILHFVAQITRYVADQIFSMPDDRSEIIC
jgi:hypothetical protein